MDTNKECDLQTILIDSGIGVGINILNGGNYKKISTWE